MQVEEELARQKFGKPALLTIGIFDGVHLGHKFLLNRLKEEAKKRDLATGVITFRQHPQELFTPEKQLPFLTSLTRRIELLKNEGIDFIVTLTFDRELAELSPRRFVTLLLLHLNMKGLVLGPDFAMGKDRQGNIDTLTKLAREMVFTLAVVPPLVINGEVVSSTAIRQALAKGDVKKVCTLAGRNFTFTGPVVTGVGRGRKLGFPTANLDVDPSQAIPDNGIYATLAHVEGKTYPSLTSIGVRPTFDNGHRTIEVYLLDFKGDLYGKEMGVEFVERLREEKKFASVEELIKQIHEDEKQGRNILAEKK